MLTLMVNGFHDDPPKQKMLNPVFLNLIGRHNREREERARMPEEVFAYVSVCECEIVCICFIVCLDCLSCSK